MKVAVYHGVEGQIAIEDVEMPRPAPHEVLVKVHSCGICGSDLAMTSGKGWDYPAGAHLGHEYCGEVVECGSQVRGLRVGDAVACIPNGFCGQCRACRDGRLLSCTNGRPQMGGMGEYVTVTERSAMPLAGKVDLAQASLVEPLACGRRALRMGRVARGDHVLVVGSGPLALSIIHNAVLTGAGRIGVLSRSGAGQDLAMQFGADYFLSANDLGEEATALVASDPPDVVVECAGAAGTVAHSASLVRPAGTVVAMGMCAQPETLTPILCTYRELTVTFPLGYSAEDFEEAIRCFDSGRVNPDAMITQRIALDEIPETFRKMRGGGHSGKTIVEMT